MRLEFLDRLSGSEVLGKSILSKDGKVLLRAGVELNSVYIDKLKDIGVFYVYIEDNRLEDVLVEDDKLTELKQSAMKNMPRIIKNVSECNRKGVKDSISIVEEMVDYIIDMGDVNKSLFDIQTYDNYTYIHSLDTSISSSFLGLTAGLDVYKLKELALGAILHDIGKTKINYAIINKDGPLTDEEFFEIKKHPLYGGKILRKNIRISDEVLSAVEQHHERIDGRGYPYGLAGNQISKYGKIVSICDVYDAVSNDRVYRKKFRPNEAYELILSGSGTIFDTDYVQDFRSTFSVYPLGCCVRLSDSTEGYVVKQNKNYPDRPIIRVLYDSETREPVPFYEINLLENTNLVVEAVV